MILGPAPLPTSTWLIGGGLLTPSFALYRFHYNINSFQLLNLLFLTRSICSSLGLSEPPRGTKQAAELTSADLERMRAYAGTYYLSTLCVVHAACMNGVRDGPLS